VEAADILVEGVLAGVMSVVDSVVADSAAVTLVVANSAALTLEVTPAAFAQDQLSQVVVHVLAGTEVLPHLFGRRSSFPTTVAPAGLRPCHVRRSGSRRTDQ